MKKKISEGTWWQQIPCPTCGADIGRSCRRMRGRDPVQEHKARVDKILDTVGKNTKAADEWPGSDLFDWSEINARLSP